MDNLKELVTDLVGMERGPKQIEKLQEIGKELLLNYVIKVSDIVIQPLWIEAYYRFDAPTHGFIDSSVHGDEQQRKYDVLYFHHKTDDRRSGVDICLSPQEFLSLGENCHLSFLLKYTLVNDVFTTQSQLSRKIPVKDRAKKGVLSFAPNPTDTIQFTKRIGITTGAYKDAELAIVRDVNQRFINASGEKKSLPQKIELLKKYIDAIYAEEQRATEEQKAEISRRLVGEYWRELFE